MKTLGPMDQLEPGTPVSVQGKLGVVKSCKVVPAYPSGMIAVHTIHFTKRYSHKTAGVPVYKPMNQTSRVNYSFIQPL